MIAVEFSEYDKMSSSQLEGLLRMDAEGINRLPLDDVLYIMKELEHRNPIPITEEQIKEAWKSFKENYYPL